MSTLKEYVKRFREQTPMPSEERVPIAREKFWWSQQAEHNELNENTGENAILNASMASTISSHLSHSSNSDGIISLFNTSRTENGSPEKPSKYSVRPEQESFDDIDETVQNALHNVDIALASVHSGQRGAPIENIPENSSPDEERATHFRKLPEDTPRLSNTYTQYLDSYTEHLLETCDALIVRSHNALEREQENLACGSENAPVAAGSTVESSSWSSGKPAAAAASEVNTATAGVQQPQPPVSGSAVEVGDALSPNLRLRPLMDLQMSTDSIISDLSDGGFDAEPGPEEEGSESALCSPTELSIGSDSALSSSAAAQIREAERLLASALVAKSRLEVAHGQLTDPTKNNKLSQALAVKVAPSEADVASILPPLPPHMVSVEESEDASVSAISVPAPVPVPGTFPPLEDDGTSLYLSPSSTAPPSRSTSPVDTTGASSEGVNPGPIPSMGETVRDVDLSVSTQFTEEPSRSNSITLEEHSRLVEEAVLTERARLAMAADSPSAPTSPAPPASSSAGSHDEYVETGAEVEPVKVETIGSFPETDEMTESVQVAALSPTVGLEPTALPPVPIPVVDRSAALSAKESLSMYRRQVIDAAAKKEEESKRNGWLGGSAKELVRLQKRLGVVQSEIERVRNEMKNLS